MNKSVQILLLLALVPLYSTAREETLEERKQRIVRKYLRDRAAITQSDMTVPSELVEDERITDSEKFKTPEVDLQRQESAAQPVVPPSQARPVPQAEENWLLQGTDENTELDMYGNPVMTEDSNEDYWAPWGAERETQKQAEPQSSGRRYDPYGRSGQTGSRGQQDSRIRSYGSSSPESGTGNDIFGRRQTQPSYSSGFGVQSSPRSYGASPDEGLLNSPFSRQDYSSRESSETERSGTYQPYKSPYQKQQEERSSSSSWSTPDSEKESQYQRSDSYQQWKSRQKKNEYDPTADDAYIDQMMKQNR